MFKTEIKLHYNNNTYLLNIYYGFTYPLNSPIKILLNNINIFVIYKEIIKKNKELFSDFSCKSHIYNTLDRCKNVKDIIYESIKIIDYKILYVKRLLLNKIINKYTVQNMDYLHYYLL